MTRKSPPAAGASTASMAACTTCRRGRGRRFPSKARPTRRVLLNVQLIMLQRVGLLEHPRIRRHTARPDRLTATALGRRRITPANLRTRHRVHNFNYFAQVSRSKSSRSPAHRTVTPSRFNQPPAENFRSACGYSRALERYARTRAQFAQLGGIEATQTLYFVPRSELVMTKTVPITSHAGLVPKAENGSAAAPS